MLHRNASLCDLPVELKVLVLSHIEHVETNQILELSSDVWEALSLLRALQQAFYFEGAPSEFADHLVHLLDDDRVRSLGRERALELIGDDKDRLCEYAWGRNFEVLKWAHNELGLPWAPYPAGRVSDDVLVLRVLRGTWQEELEGWWPEDKGPEQWDRVTMENGRVVELEFGPDYYYEVEECELTGAVPAEIGRLTSLEVLGLNDNQLTSVPAEIGQLTSLAALNLGNNRLTSVPAEIGQLTSLRELYLDHNSLTSVPAEIGQLTSLNGLHLDYNQLESLPAEIGQLTSLEVLELNNNQLTSLPAEIGQLTSLEMLPLSGNRLTSVPAEIGQLTSLRELNLRGNQLTSVPAEIGQLTSLEELDLGDNRLTSVPAEIWQLTSLRWLNLRGNRLTSVPAATRELRAAGCRVSLDDGVKTDKKNRRPRVSTET